jgi:hypothetical protein
MFVRECRHAHVTAVSQVRMRSQRHRPPLLRCGVTRMSPAVMRNPFAPFGGLGHFFLIMFVFSVSCNDLVGSWTPKGGAYRDVQ